MVTSELLEEHSNWSTSPGSIGYITAIESAALSLAIGFVPSGNPPGPIGPRGEFLV